MSVLNIRPEQRQQSPANAEYLAKLNRLQNMEVPITVTPDVKDQDIMLNRIDTALTQVTESNPQSPYIHQLMGLRTAFSSGKISANEAQGHLVTISQQATPDIQEAKEGKKEGLFALIMRKIRG
jgi:hypothetical protein